MLKRGRLVENPIKKWWESKNMQLGNFLFPAPTEYWKFILWRR